MHKEWLKKKTTVCEAEASHMVEVEHRAGSPQSVPSELAFENANARWLAGGLDGPARRRVWLAFGHANAGWLALVAKMQEGDELWTFDSPLETWENLCGRTGYSIVRDGEIIASLSWDSWV